MHWITRERPKIDRIACPWLIDRRFNDVPLHTLARIVRGAECGQLHLAPEASDFIAVSKGLSLNFADDHEMLVPGMLLQGALYAWCLQ